MLSFVEQQSKIINKTRNLSEVSLKSVECDLLCMYLHLRTQHRPAVDIASYPISPATNWSNMYTAVHR